MRDQLVENEKIEKMIDSKTTHAEKSMLFSWKEKIISKTIPSKTRSYKVYFRLYLWSLCKLRHKKAYKNNENAKNDLKCLSLYKFRKYTRNESCLNSVSFFCINSAV